MLGHWNEPKEYKSVLRGWPNKAKQICTSILRFWHTPRHLVDAVDASKGKAKAGKCYF